MSEQAGAPGATRRCIERLAARGDDVRRALAGRSLTVVLRYAGRPPVQVVFTRDGFVAVTPLDDDASVTLTGPAADVAAFLRGSTILRDAVLGGLVTLHMPESEVASYAALRSLVAEVLAEAD